MKRALLRLMLLGMAACVTGAVAAPDDAPADPMRALIGRQPPNVFDPMKRLPKLDEYVEYDPMAYYARRAAAAPDNPADPMAALRGVENPAAPIGDEKLGGLPPGEGQIITLGLCSMCHSIQMVTQQRLPEHRWDELWDWMIQQQGMPDVGEPTRTQVLTYLKKNFSSPVTIR